MAYSCKHGCERSVRKYCLVVMLCLAVVIIMIDDVSVLFSRSLISLG